MKQVSRMDAGELREHLAYRMSMGASMSEIGRLVRMISHRTGVRGSVVYANAKLDLQQIQATA